MYSLYFVFVQVAYGAVHNYNQFYPPEQTGVGPSNTFQQPPSGGFGQGNMGFQGIPAGGQAPSLMQLCSSMGPEAVHGIRCSDVSQNDMAACFGTRGRDQTIASLIRACPYQLPPDYFSSSLRLRSSGLLLSFSALLSDGRCNDKIVEAQRHHLLQILLKENDFDYTQAFLQFCQIQPSVLDQYADVAKQFGWDKVEPLLRTKSPPAPLRQHPTDSSIKEQRRADGTNNLQDPNVLSSMTPTELERFGAIGNVCEGLDSSHFKSKDLHTTSLSLINANCFRHLKPEAFSGLSGEQVAALRPWDVATPEQVSKIGLQAIASLPFDKLGKYKQRSGSDAFHPCHGVTDMQRVSLRLHGDAWAAYNDRCKKPTSSSTLSSPLNALTLLSLLFIGLLLN